MTSIVTRRSLPTSNAALLARVEPSDPLRWLSVFLICIGAILAVINVFIFIYEARRGYIYGGKRVRKTIDEEERPNSTMEDSSPDPFATPLQTSNGIVLPFQSSVALSSGENQQILPSSKATRGRGQQYHLSSEIMSMSDTLRPISTIPSTSIWPEHSRDESTEGGGSNITPTTSTHRTSVPTSIPSKNSRSVHATTSRELAQMLRDSRQSEASSITITESSPISRIWTKDAESKGNGR